ncbi:MAG: MOSC domain-containing protein [Acidimicrobiales bacterium]
MTTTTSASSSTSTTMRVAEIWRHPVKSLQGEQLTSAGIESDGLRGDRRWGVLDEETGRILTGRREPQLLFASASLTADDEPVIVLADGTTCRGVGPATDEALSDWLHRPVRLVPASAAAGGSAEYFADATDDASQAIEWTMPPGRFVDAMALLVLTRASLEQARTLHPSGEWNVRRFRPNLVLDGDLEGWAEDAWYGHTLRVGSAVLAPQQPCVRCTMVTRSQPGLDRDLTIYKTLARHRGATFGAWTAVNAPGTISTGDAVELA